jgi:hypothetical protein
LSQRKRKRTPTPKIVDERAPDIMTTHSKASRFHTLGGKEQGRGGVGDKDHDAYRLRAKPPEPTWCPDCGAVYEKGRWQWKERVASKAPGLVCSACQRIRDDFPAGYLQIDGDFARENREDLMRLVRHRAEHAKAEHPMQRIMAIKDEGAGVLVTTTDLHLARDIGEALHRAYHGELDLRYSDDENLVRVHWQR